MPLMRLYVEKAGRHVTRFQPADRVYSRLPVSSLGAFAECIAVPALAAARMPEGLDSVTASAIPLTGQTVYQAIAEKLCAKPGETFSFPAVPAIVEKNTFPLIKRFPFTLAGAEYDRKAKRQAKAYRFLFVQADGAQLEKITRIVEANHIVPKIDPREFDLSQINDAL